MEYLWMLMATWPLVSGLILPMTDKDGQPHYAGMINHITLMEQTVSGLQTSFQETQSRVTTLEAKLAEKELELATNKRDLKETKSSLFAAERDIAVLRAKQEHCPNMSEFDQVKLNISSLGRKLTASNLNVSHLLALSDTAAADIQVLTKNLSQLSNNVSISLTRENNVAFQVTNTASYTTGYTILRFDTVRVNNGGGYNKNTGIFTAPVKGSYLFWVDVDVAVDSKAVENEDYICIMKDGNCLIKAVSINNPDGGKWWSVASTMAITNLVQGQTIHFEIGSTLSHIGGITESCYGGALLRADYD